MPTMVVYYSTKYEVWVVATENDPRIATSTFHEREQALSWCVENRYPYKEIYEP